ncbi:MAG: lactate racemase domain-containing protein [Candidatus Hermodarchaeota archaeon]
MSKIKIPWAAWREPGFLELKFPESWDTTIFHMNDSEEISDKEIENSILNPLGTASLLELAKGKENAVIVIDDMTRPTPVSKIMPFILNELESVGISKDKITIILAIGAHRPMNRHDCILKLGKEIVDNMNIENHHPYENLTNLGKSKIGTDIDVNTTYYNADLKIAVGGVVPHPLAGFGGGAKMVLPGVCGIRTLEGNHKAGLEGKGAGIGRMTSIREDIEDIASKVGLDFSVNVVFTKDGNIGGIFAGHFKDAHRKAMELAKNTYNTKVTLNNQICFFNSWPEDSELNQAQYKALNFMMTAPSKLLDRDGAMVLMSSAYEGRGYHSLMSETGSKLHHNAGNAVVWRAFVKKKRVFFYSPNVNQHDINHYYPDSVKLFNEWDPLIAELEEIYGNSPKVGILPTSMQLAE